MMAGIEYSDKMGYLPVVDMKNYPNLYLYPSEVGHVNAWEYYFTQPGDLSLDEALSSRKYILGRDSALFKWPGYPNTSDLELFNNVNGKLEHWRRLCRKYIHLTKPVLKRLDREAHKFDGLKVLGVSIRGTDYTALRPKGHPVQPTAEQAITKASEVMNVYGYDAVYLATEDTKHIAAFTEAFGEKLILPETECYDYDPAKYKIITYYSSGKENGKYITGLEYLVSKLMLTKCKGLITSITSGTTGIMCLSEGWEYTHVFDLGLYP